MAEPEKILIEDERLTPDLRRTRSGSTMKFNKPGNDSLQSEDADISIKVPRKELYAELIDGSWYWINGCAKCCGREPSWEYVVCDKHDLCVGCGTPRKALTEIPWGGEKGFTCKPCERSRIQFKIAGFQAKDHDDDFFEYTDQPICRNCGEEIQDYYPNMDEQEQKLNCPSCNHPLSIVANMSFTYDTYSDKSGVKTDA